MQCRPSTSHVDCLPGPLHAGRHPSSKPPSIAHSSRPGRGPEGRSNLGARRRWRTGSAHVATPRQSKSHPHPTPPPARASQAWGRRAARTGPGSPPHTYGPRARSLRGSRAAPPGHYFSRPSHSARAGRDRDSTPRASRSDGSRSGDVAGASSPGLLRATPRVAGFRPASSPGGPLPSVAPAARRPPPVRSLPRGWGDS